MPNAYNADGARIYGYLTIPEDARIGVCAHELGHLLFGFPDLYDVDGSSEGVGNWCLMGAGSWGGDGDVPTHPSAWCKIQQGWAKAVNVTGDGTLSIPDVKNSFEVHRLWTDGQPGKEYFLVENRQRTGYDVSLPAPGLQIWHVDEGQPDNTNENHYMVGLVQADNRRDLEWATNRGDEGDVYPGSTGNSTFGPSSRPGSQSYAGAPTGVSITDISAPDATMTATVSVSAAGSVRRPVAGVAGPEMEDTPGLVRTIHDLQDRLATLEQAVAPWARRGGPRAEHAARVQGCRGRAAAAAGRGGQRTRHTPVRGPVPPVASAHGADSRQPHGPDRTAGPGGTPPPARGLGPGRGRCHRRRAGGSYADLLSRNVGQRLLLAVPGGLLADAVPGSTVRARARLAASGEAMAEKRPDPGTFAVEPPR
ncbi:M6 family metalloprotease domain-containing protein [Kitasatospora arboriphila]